MPGLKTNERPGTRAVLRHYRMSAYKAREVLDLIRGRDVDRAEELLRTTPREAARVVGKVLASAVANARNNDLLDPDELYVSACFADEGTTMKRWRPRARGRATRIRKRTCHITVIVSRLPEDRLERHRARTERAGALRSRRVAASKRTAEAPADQVAEVEEPSESLTEAEVVDDAAQDAVIEAEPEAEEVADEDEEEVEASAEELEPEDAHSATDETETDETDTDEAESEAPAKRPRRGRATRTRKQAPEQADEDEPEVAEADSEADEAETDEDEDTEPAKKTRRPRVPRVRKRAQGKD
jgi:large subunit ribosomal protein L22